MFWCSALTAFQPFLSLTLTPTKPVHVFLVILSLFFLSLPHIHFSLHLLSSFLFFILSRTFILCPLLLFLSLILSSSRSSPSYVCVTLTQLQMADNASLYYDKMEKYIGEEDYRTAHFFSRKFLELCPGSTVVLLRAAEILMHDLKYDDAGRICKWGCLLWDFSLRYTVCVCVCLHVCVRVCKCCVVF